MIKPFWKKFWIVYGIIFLIEVILTFGLNLDGGSGGNKIIETIAGIVIGPLLLSMFPVAAVIPNLSIDGFLIIGFIGLVFLTALYAFVVTEISERYTKFKQTKK